MLQVNGGMLVVIISNTTRMAYVVLLVTFRHNGSMYQRTPLTLLGSVEESSKNDIPAQIKEEAAKPKAATAPSVKFDTSMPTKKRAQTFAVSGHGSEQQATMMGELRKLYDHRGDEADAVIHTDADASLYTDTALLQRGRVAWPPTPCAA